MSTEENKAIIRRLNAVGDSREVEAWVAFFAPDATNHGRPVGRAGFRRVREELLATFSDSHSTIEEIVAEGDVVVTRQRATAIHAGAPTSLNVHNLLGVPPTGKPVVMHSIHIWHLKDGLITDHAAVRDDLEVLRQLGLWPPPGVAPGPG